MNNDFCTIEEALAELRAGRMIVLVDDEHRENEGDLVIPAEKATPEGDQFHDAQRLRHRLPGHVPGHLPASASGAAAGPQSSIPRPRRSRQSIDARTGITTGTSAFDRARTVAVAIDDNSGPADLVRGKGHVSGLRAREGGVLVRAGHTEGSVDLARLAGFKEAAVICEIVDPDGHMARSARTADVLPAARAQDVHHRGADQVSPAARTAHSPGIRRQAADPTTATST